jgi:hypothetical protein
LLIGPSTLNTVRMPRSRRGSVAFRNAQWYAGANRNATPTSLIVRAASAGVWSTKAPSASSTSAEPARELTARLPCLATCAPAAAATNATAVETLNVPDSSPPVPQVSSNGRGTSGNGWSAWRIARARPATSSTVSPRMRSATAKPAICAGVAAPASTSCMTPNACSSDRVSPPTTRGRSSRIIAPPWGRP